MRRPRRVGLEIGWLMVSCFSLTTATWSCKCGHFTMDAVEWKPLQFAFGSPEDYKVDCSITNTNDSNLECQKFCEEETHAMNLVFSKDPNLLRLYAPEPSLPCDAFPREIGSYYRSCGRTKWLPTQSQLFPSVCCHPTELRPVWCESLSHKTVPEMRGYRKMNTGEDKNAIENNEIEDSIIVKPMKEDSGSKDDVSWLTFFMDITGTQSLNNFLREVTFFNFPSKIGSIIKDYQDELTMGRCYMEYTTYIVFERQENPLDLLLRTKRELAIPEEVEFAVTNSDDRRGNDHREGRFFTSAKASSLLGLATPILAMLESSPSTRPYVGMATKLLPILDQVYSSEDPQVPITSFITQMLGSYLSQVSSGGSSNSIDRNEPAKTKPPPADSSNSLITSLILDFAKYYMGNYMSSLPGTKVTKPPSLLPERDTSPPPVNKRPTYAESSSSPGLGALLNLVMGPSVQTTNKSPHKVKEPPKKTVFPVRKERDLAQMILEFIRPVFISIVGKAPGDSGVDAIREAYHLSTLGRVDDTLVEEILSPMFCVKNYFVNKAWTMTERGVRSVLTRFEPRERERMMRMLKEAEEKRLEIVAKNENNLL